MSTKPVSFHPEGKKVEGMQQEIRRLENDSEIITRIKNLEENFQTQTIRINQLEQDLEEKERRIQELENAVTQVQEDEGPEGEDKMKNVNTPKQNSSQQPQPDRRISVDILHDPNVKLEWTQCCNLPEVMYDGSTAVVGDFVYAGGGMCEMTTSYDSVRTVFGYNYRRDTWVNLPITDRHRFTLVSYQNQLVLVGGAIPSIKVQHLSSLAVWDEKTRQWIEPYPPMHTQRMQPSAVSHGQHIVVAGGTNKEDLDSVEVYDGNTKQWHLVAPLPAKTSRATSAVLGGFWYLIGGKRQGRAVYFTSLDSLIGEAVQPQSGGCDAIWKSLPSTDFTFSTAAAFGNAILAIGGSKSVGNSDAVRAYFPGRKLWLPLKNPLPRPFYSSSAVVVPTGELILIGGCTDLSRYNHVYKASFKHFS